MLAQNCEAWVCLSFVVALSKRMRDWPGSISVGCQVNLANRDPSPGFTVYTQFNNGTKGRALFVMSCPKIHGDITDFFMSIHDAVMQYIHVP